MGEKTQDISCPHCGNAGRIQWGTPSPSTKMRRIEHLTHGFVFIEAGDGAVRIECRKCGAPISGMGAELAGWERGRYF